MDLKGFLSPGEYLSHHVHCWNYYCQVTHRIGHQSHILFSEVCIFFLVMQVHEIFVDSKFSICKTTSNAKGIVDFVLCDEIFLSDIYRIMKWKMNSLPVKIRDFG